MTTPVANETLDLARNVAESIPVDPGTVTDGRPKIITLAGMPTRPFAYFDYRLLKKLSTSDVMDEEEQVIALAYSIAQTSDYELDALYELFENLVLLKKKVLRWSMNLPMEELAQMSNHVAKMLTEYVESDSAGAMVSEPIGGIEGSAEGNSRPKAPESPISDAPSSDSPE